MTPLTPHFIAGHETPSISGRTFTTVNPATGTAIGEVAFGEQQDVDRAVSAAWTAYRDGAWRNSTPASRAACLRRVASLIRDRAEDIARIESIDAGKPIREARNDVEGAAGLLEFSSTLPENIRGHVFPQPRGHLSYSTREPYGVVGAIAPWNFPFLNAVAKTAPALAVGNSVVLKMAEQTPLSTTVYAQLCAEAGLPAGVLNVVHGDGPTTGAALVQHPGVPKLTFTGSTETGRQILHTSAESIKSCHLELGGKSPNIVFADADIEQALAGALFTSFWNSGQVCSAGSRLLVEESIADDFVLALCERAQSLVVGDPACEGTQLGPLVSSEQLHRVTAFVNEGRSSATIATGGETPILAPPLDHGYFLAPTIFDNVTSEMVIAQDEIFGPVLAIMRFRSEQEALKLANDVVFGLTATVWTNRLDRMLAFSEQLEAGVIWTNWPHGGAWHTPYEGHKASGFGEDLGLEAIQTFSKLKVHHMRTIGHHVA